MSRFEALWACYVSGQMTPAQFMDQRRTDPMFDALVKRWIRKQLEDAKRYL